MQRYRREGLGSQKMHVRQWVQGPRRVIHPTDLAAIRTRPAYHVKAGDPTVAVLVCDEWR
jgi:hypothetical protein